MCFKQVMLFAGMLMFYGNVLASDPHDADSSGEGSSEADGHTAANPNESHAIHWGYSGDDGPAHWSSLSGDYSLCSSGKRQSPIDLKSSEDHNLYPLSFEYKAVPLQVLNNGHTLQANYNQPNEDEVTIGGVKYPLVAKTVYASQLMVGTVPYDLLQFHFHSPSEHAASGERHVMEVHLVHKAADGNLAVVGVFMKVGEKNHTLQKIIDNLSNTVNKVALIKAVEVNASELLPKHQDVYHYSGSLTTPPCSENVNWYVMKEQIEVSAEQVSQFTALLGENARPIQEMHWRTLLSSN